MEEVLARQLLAVTPFGVFQCSLDPSRPDYIIHSKNLVIDISEYSDWVTEDQTSLGTFLCEDLGGRLLNWLLDPSRKPGEHVQIRAHNSFGNEKQFLMSIKALENGELLLHITEQSTVGKAILSMKDRLALLQPIIDLEPNIVCVMDSSGRYVLVNTLFAEIIGKTKEEIIGTTEAEFRERFVVEEFGGLKNNPENAVMVPGREEELFKLLSVTTEAGEKHWFRCSEISMEKNGFPGYVLGVAVDVTSEIMTSRDLQAQVRLMDSLLETVPIPIYYQDRKSVYLGCNQAFLDLTGYSREEVIGHSILDIWPESRAKQYLEENEVVYQNLEKYIVSRQETMKHGNTSYVEVLKAPYFDTEGEAIGIIGAVLDFTERRKIQAELKKREELLSRILDTAPVGIGIVRGGNFIWVNDYFCTMLGYEREEVINQPSDMLFPVDNGLTLTREDLSRALQSEEVGIFEVNLRRKDGSRLLCQQYIKLSDPNQLESELTFALLDIEERKRAEDALRQQELYFRTVFEESPIGISVVDLDMCYQDLNPAFEELIGYSTSELVGRKPCEITHPDDLERNLKLQDQLWRGDIPQYRMEKRYFHKNGRIVDVLLVASMIYDSHGNPIRSIGQNLDISQRKRAEEEVRKINLELEERVRVRTVELEAANEDLRRFVRLAAGRENRMAELKNELRAFRARIQKADTHKIDSER